MTVTVMKGEAQICRVEEEGDSRVHARWNAARPSERDWRETSRGRAATLRQSLGAPAATARCHAASSKHRRQKTLVFPGSSVLQKLFLKLQTGVLRKINEFFGY